MPTPSDREQALRRDTDRNSALLENQSVDVMRLMEEVFLKPQAMVIQLQTHQNDITDLKYWHGLMQGIARIESAEKRLALLEKRWEDMQRRLWAVFLPLFTALMIAVAGLIWQYHASSSPAPAPPPSASRAKPSPP